MTEGLTPIGILRVATGASPLQFGPRATSAAWVEAWPPWWGRARAGLGPVQRLVISLDDGPTHSNQRAPFWERMVPIADRSGWEIRRVDDPPDPGKSHPIERCWSAPEKEWSGVLLDGLKVVPRCALGMTWKGRHPTVKRLQGANPDGVRVAAQEMKQIEARLRRSATLPKSDITIKPRVAEGQVN